MEKQSNDGNSEYEPPKLNPEGSLSKIIRQGGGEFDDGGQFGGPSPGS